MTAKEALTKLTVMLGLNTEEVVTATETVNAQFAEATLVDGTVVSTEGEMMVGSVLYVVTEEGNVTAPEGMHETTDGQIVTVDADGTILSIEDKAAETPADAPVEAATSEMAELPADATPAEEAINESVTEVTDDVVAQIAELIQPAIEQINVLQDEIAALKANFSAFKDEPAGKKITNNLTEFKQAQETFSDARFEALKKIRNGKN